MAANEVPLLKKDISIMNDKLDTLTKDFKDHTDKMETYFERLEHKFAGKWTEKILIFIGSAVWIAIVGAIMALIIKK